MITAFQHIGMGRYDVDKTYAFWKDNLGFKIKLNDHTGYDEQMEPILGERLEMRMLMAMNAAGGGIVELVEVNKLMFMPPVVFKSILYWPLKAAARVGIV